MVGFGRVVTDYSTVYWICDIIIDENHRGNGLGKRLVESITSAKELEGLLGILATRDAHGLYEHYGFEKDTDRFMKKKEQGININGTGVKKPVTFIFLLSFAISVIMKEVRLKDLAQKTLIRPIKDPTPCSG